jgi:hypothetical protein
MHAGHAQVRNIVDASAIRDIQDSSAYTGRPPSASSRNVLPPHADLAACVHALPARVRMPLPTALCPHLHPRALAPACAAPTRAGEEFSSTRLMPAEEPHLLMVPCLRRSPAQMTRKATHCPKSTASCTTA